MADICEVLKFVNQVRSDFGLNEIVDMKPGRVGDANCCPITNSIMFGAKGLTVSTGIGMLSAIRGECRRNYRMEGAAREFVSEFDAGLIPELDDGTSEFEDEDV